MKNTVAVATFVGIPIGLAGMWAFAALNARMGLNPFLSAPIASALSILVGVLVLAKLEALSSWRWMIFIGCQMVWVVWCMVFAGAGWLPDVVQDLAPRVTTLVGEHTDVWTIDDTCLVLAILGQCLIIIPYALYELMGGVGSVSGSSSRSTAGSSVGTPSTQSIPSTSYDSPPVPTWTYQAPPATPRLTDHQIKQDSDYRAAQAQNDWNRRQGS